MRIDEIMGALQRFSATFPRQALEEAVQQREEITPLLLDALRDTVERAEILALDPDHMVHNYAMLLLAQFREARAYPLVVQFARLPEEQIDGLAGDFITEGLSDVLASVCGGDISLIQALIEDPAADEFARGAGIQTLVTLVCAGDLSRDDAIAYFQALFDERLDRKPSQVWSELVSSSIDLYPDVLLDRIHAAWNDGLADTFVVGPKHLDRVLAKGREEMLTRLNQGPAVYIQDAIEEIEWWACFDSSPQAKTLPRVFPAKKRLDLFPLLSEGLYSPSDFSFPSLAAWEPPRFTAKRDRWEDEPPVRLAVDSGPRIGVNDPCPCGSGKKYKKCCGRQGQQG